MPAGTPLSVVHVNGRTIDNRPWLIEECISAFHMKRAEAELLRFYALKCSNGFKPATLFIERQTGLPRASIFRARDLLIEDGVINISNRFISVDWNRIRVFAFLNNETAMNNTPAMALQRRNRLISPARKIEWTDDEYNSNLFKGHRSINNHDDIISGYKYLLLPPNQIEDWIKQLNEEELCELNRKIEETMNSSQKK